MFDHPTTTATMAYIRDRLLGLRKLRDNGVIYDHEYQRMIPEFLTECALMPFEPSPEDEDILEDLHTSGLVTPHLKQFIREWIFEGRGRLAAQQDETSVDQ